MTVLSQQTNNMRIFIAYGGKRIHLWIKGVLGYRQSYVSLNDHYLAGLSSAADAKLTQSVGNALENSFLATFLFVLGAQMLKTTILATEKKSAAFNRNENFRKGN